MTEKVLVCGSRSFSDASAIRSRLKTFGPDITVITGGAKGADKLAHEVAVELGLQTIVVHANWREYGKAAGPIRNKQMLAMEPDTVLAFWDGQSKGTKHTIDEARKRDIRLWIVTP